VALHFFIAQIVVKKTNKQLRIGGLSYSQSSSSTMSIVLGWLTYVSSHKSVGFLFYFVYIGFGLAIAFLSTLLIITFILRHRTPDRRGCVTTIGFFHPYAAGGGGGERVLWCAVGALDRAAKAAGVALDVLIYCGGDFDARTLIARASADFGVSLPEPEESYNSSSAKSGVAARRNAAVVKVGANLRFVRVTGRFLLEASTWPRFTLLGQSFGSILLALECVTRARVDVWIDTTGAAFTLPLVRAAGAQVAAAYIHYPTISSEMLSRVAARTAAFNNNGTVARSALLTNLKLYYYRAFAMAYRWAGQSASPGGAMANSQWTAAHIKELWGRDPTVVYPPCPTEALRTLPAGSRTRLVVSLAQFRPEKEHSKQLHAFANFRARSRNFDDVRLALVGGARGAEDEARVAALRELARTLCVEAHVDFYVNAPLAAVRTLLGKATAGLHTMASEHFGIGVVEMQAAGVVVIAHDSGGPQADIVVPPWRRTSLRNAAPPVGLLAASVEEYATALQAVFSGSVNVQAVAAAGRVASARFSEGEFEKAFIATLWPLIEIAAALAATATGGGMKTAQTAAPAVIRKTRAASSVKGRG
jgi:alpha-1,2-mannosyltransferase